MKLTKWIFLYWWHFINLQIDTSTTMWTFTEGLIEYQSYVHGTLRYMTFWYILNHEWYRMNNKMFANTNCKLPYEQPMDECLEDRWN